MGIRIKLATNAFMRCRIVRHNLVFSLRFACRCLLPPFGPRAVSYARGYRYCSPRHALPCLPMRLLPRRFL